MGSNPTQELKSIPFSNDTVVHINELGADREEQLCDILWDSPFRLQLDETTTSENSPLLTAHICYRLSYRQEMANEFLFSKYLETDIMDIFFLYCSVQVTHILACTFDGAPCMFGRYCGFTPHILTVHHVFHRHNLVAKSKSALLYLSLNATAKAIKQNKSPCPDCFHNCVRNTVTHLSVFFSILMSASSLLGAVCGVPGEGWCSSWGKGVIQINEFMLKLQENCVTLVQCKAVNKILISRLDLCRENISRGLFPPFQQLTKEIYYFSETRLNIYNRPAFVIINIW